MNLTKLDSRKLDKISAPLPRNPLSFTAWSPRTSAQVAGGSLAVMAVLGGFGNFGAFVPLIIPGNASLTVHNISHTPLLFLAGVVSFVIVAILDIIVAGALYTLFTPVSRRLSAAAAWMRSAYAVLLLVAISQLILGYTMLGDPESALPVLESFNTIWVISLGLFGMSLLLIGYLAFRSGFIAKVFGILLVIAGLGYVADATGMAFVPDFSAVFAQFMFVGEVAIIFWLLIKGRRLPAN